MTTLYWSDIVLNATFYRILSGFHITFATDVACRQGKFTPPDTWSRPFGTCICFTCWDQSFVRTCRYFSPYYALRISLGTFSIFLKTRVTPEILQLPDMRLSQAVVVTGYVSMINKVTSQEQIQEDLKFHFLILVVTFYTWTCSQTPSWTPEV